MSNESVTYIILTVDGTRKRIPLDGNSVWNIGRSDDCPILVNLRWISRNHAMIRQTDAGEYFLIDLGSRNGTFVNAKRISIPVMLKSGDEISFGQTSAGEAFLKFYCPSAQLESSHTCDSQVSATFQVSEQQLITVLVMDIREFTKLTLEMDQANLSKMIGTWFGEASEIIQKYGCSVDKYIGDAIMVVRTHSANEPVGGEIKQMFFALRDLWKMTQSLQSRFPTPIPLRVGAGLNTGYAIIGNQGTSERPDFSPLGDAVNAAFRLESSTKELGQDIAIGDVTYQWLRSVMNGKELPFRQHQVLLKGYSEPTTAYTCRFTELDECFASH
jgi:adenylate cyclase